MHIINIFSCAQNFYIANNKSLCNNDIIILKNTEEECITSYSELSFLSNKQVHYLPSLDIDYYERNFSTPKIQLARSIVLSNLTTNSPHNGRIIITHAKNITRKLAPLSIFQTAHTIICARQTLNINTLLAILIQNGFNRSSNAMDPGEFAVRGQIVDIVIEQNIGYRLIFDGDIIEEIKTYHTNTQLSYGSTKEISLYPISEIIFNQDTIENFQKCYLQNFGVNHQNDQLITAISAHRKFPGYENFLPLFYSNLVNLTNYLNNPIIVYDQFVKQNIIEYYKEYEQAYQNRLLTNKTNKEYYHPVLSPEQLLISQIDLGIILNNEYNIFFSHTSDDRKTDIFPIIPNIQENSEEPLITLITENISTKKIIICCKLLSQLQKLKYLLNNNNLTTETITNITASKKNLVNLAILSLNNSFYNNDYLMLSYNDFFKDKQNLSNKTSSKARLKNILIELEGIEPGEYVIHKEHGIGQFLALENVKVQVIAEPVSYNITSNKATNNIVGKSKTISYIGHDCIKILYADNAKLYIPVENIDNIKKYGYSEATLDKLGGIAWQKRKAKLKTRINEIASKILQIAAKRKSQQIMPISIDYSAYDEFCKKFHFVETDDQLKAIDEIKQDLLSGKIMDRLICGDVGFGKTEVALRAAFLVANDKSDDKPQVAIIVPTTILCRQHYNRCLERFANHYIIDSDESPHNNHTVAEIEGTTEKIKLSTSDNNKPISQNVAKNLSNNYNLKIAELSRLVSTTQTKNIKEDLASGKINIIIGTHALLSKDIKFYNLKLLIIDEEQHFGVLQKEKLKEFKSSIHVLSLSATPIPRTLQMSMVGIKDLSLIATPPIGRLPIKTTILPFDFDAIREALLNEYTQGGKSFYVVPRISDIPTVEKRLQTMVPKLKVAIMHGELPVTQIDKIMEKFNNGETDILLSTAIIESGIDITIANTMIVHRTDQFGLAQIYQLRGRIGRGKKRASAYLTLEKNKITDKARKRLELLQNSDHFGGGFAIASHDMDIRGYGNLVGSEQAGHIKEVGIELYQEMLDEELMNLQPDNRIENNTTLSPVINLGISVFISEQYISDNVLRLGIYRRIGNLTNLLEIENFTNEMIDRFGPLPVEFQNLLGILEIKFLCIKLNIENLDVTEKGAVIKFVANTHNEQLIIKLMSKYTQQVKIRPNHKMIYVKNFNKSKIIDETIQLLTKFLLCELK